MEKKKWPTVADVLLQYEPRVLPVPLATLPKGAVRGDAGLAGVSEVTTYMSDVPMGEEAAIDDARYVIGSWWIDELTNPAVIFVCHRTSSGRYVPMDRCRTVDDARMWSQHYACKQWKDDDDAPLPSIIRDLETALVLAAHLQALRDKRKGG